MLPVLLAAASELSTPSLTVAARAGYESLSAKYFGPYTGGGTFVGLHPGIRLHPLFAVSAFYEHGFHSAGKRNPGGAASTDFFGVTARLLAMGRPHTTSMHLEVAFGRRRFGYDFSRDDPSSDPFQPAPTNPQERATLWGSEGRVAFGLGIGTWARPLAIDLLLAFGGGRFDRYSDTLDCATFRFGACGAGKDFGYVTTTFAVGLRWN